MKTSLVLVLSLVSFINGVAADTYPYDWETTRKQYELTAAEKSLSEIFLKNHFEYAYQIENDQLIMYSVFHQIVRVNNNEAIQRHNRLRISLERTFNLVELKARVITASGKVINFDKNNLKEVNEEGSDNASRLFAMEGVEVGSEVEYFVVRKMSPTVFGKLYFQKDVPIKEVSFILKSPKNLEFEFKSYHGLPAMETQEQKPEDDQNVYKLVARDLAPSKEEAFAHADARNKRVEFKLAYNKARSFAKMYTWDYAGKEFYARLFTLSKDEEKAISKFAASLKDDASKSQQTRIRDIERKIKTSFQIQKDANDEPLKNIASVLKYKTASAEGITKLFLSTFSSLKIPVYLVLTCDRRYRQFDETFDSWNFLDDYLLYFPETSTFLSPYSENFFSPLIEPYYTSQKGLFIEPIQVGSLRSALASVQDIPASPWKHNSDNMNITVKFNDDLSANEISQVRSFFGNSASYIAPYYHLMSEEEKKRMIEEMMKSTAPGLSINKWTGKTNFEGEVDEFSMDVNYSTSHFIERAGPRILFKVGLIIGPQSELYQDDKRVLPVENDSNRGYERTIVVTIPDGYTIKNPNDLNFNVLYKDGESIPFSFESSYKLQGQTLTIIVNEYYKQLYAPLERYEDFRKVINAAADFNKVTLVLEKKK